MKIHVRIIEIKGEGWAAIIFNRDADEAELVDSQFFRTKNEARDAAARNVLHAGGFEDGELVSEIALRLGFTFKAFTDFLEASEFPVALNVAIQTPTGYGLMLQKNWTLDYLGVKDHG